MRILFLGAGKMVQAMLPKLHHDHHHFFFYSPSGESAAKAAHLVNGKVVPSLNELPEVDAYCIACKPQQFNQLAKDIVDKLDPTAVIISIMAAVTLSRIHTSLKNPHVLRIMPNTPVGVGQGIVPICFCSTISEAAKEKWINFLQPLGMVIPLEKEGDLEKFTPFSGSGPGFIFEWARIWQQELMKQGFDYEMSRAVIAQLFLGSGQLMNEQKESFEEMRNAVTSKAGITAAGLDKMRDNQFERITADIFKAATSRQIELTSSGNTK